MAGSTTGPAEEQPPTGGPYADQEFDHPINGRSIRPSEDVGRLLEKFGRERLCGHVGNLDH